MYIKETERNIHTLRKMTRFCCCWWCRICCWRCLSIAIHMYTW